MDKNTSHKQNGVSLVEILVAVFVVSIGLLGVARMEILAKQANVEAIQRTAATQIAHDMIEKMRANPKQLAGYVGQVLGAGKLAMPATNCDIAKCNSTDMVNWDLYQWDQSLIGAGEKAAGGNNTGGLDTPRGCITSTVATPGDAGEYTISIAWRGKAPMTDNNATVACGQKSGLYGATDEYRRVLSLTLFISNDGV